MNYTPTRIAATGFGRRRGEEQRPARSRQSIPSAKQRVLKLDTHNHLLPVLVGDYI
jgi:hypothetical protein